MVVILASLMFSAQLVQANETIPSVTPYHFDEQGAKDGWTLRTVNDAELGVFPGVLPGPADVIWSVSTEPLPALPEKTKKLGAVFKLSISGVSSLQVSSTNRLAVALPDTGSLWQRSIWLYDTSTKTWTKLISKYNGTTKKWQAGFLVLDAYLVVLEDRDVQQGIASWYCKNHCSARYPTLHATSNDFPVGSYITVRNIANDKSVDVKIISRWGQPAGRVVDLSYAAFSKLKSSNGGLARVQVFPKSLIATPTRNETTSTVTTSEIIPNLKVTSLSTSAVPSVTAAAYRIIDASTGLVLAEKNSDAIRSIASLTKLMTAIVFLDSNPDFKKVVTYSKADVTSYAYLRIKLNDQMTTKDLFYSLIVGSANNAATALARSTGMTQTDFISAMNAKAKSWGLHQTSFTDVSGLDVGNVSTAAETAILAQHAFHDYPMVRKASVVQTYTFTTKNTKVKHTIKTTDKLLAQKNNLTITGGKTGFLNESKYTYVLRTKNTQGAQVIVALLGSSTSAARFQESVDLSSWAWKNYTWS